MCKNKENGPSTLHTECFKKPSMINEEDCRFVLQAIAITSTCTSFFMLICPHQLCFVHNKTAVVVTEPMTIYVHEDESSSSRCGLIRGYFLVLFNFVLLEIQQEFPEKGKASQIYTISFLEKRKIPQISCQERDKTCWTKTTQHDIS